MTEMVQKHLELMSEELREMQRIKLLTSAEVGDIVIKRREFENKVHGLTNELKHYTKYITYETTLLKTLKLRRDKKKMYHKQESVEHKIIKRIKSLYETAFDKFPPSVELFRSFLKFCKLVNYVNTAVDIVATVVMKSYENPEICQIAAKWHAEERQDMNTAIIMLLKGTAIHKHSQLLYKEIIAIELLSYTTKSQTSQDPHIQVTCLKKLESVINTIFAYIRDYEFYIEVLKDLEQWEFTANIQKLIIDFLLQHYSNNENVWHALAQREQRVSYHLPESNDSLKGASLNEVQKQGKNTPKARLDACFAKYREGLSKIDAANKPKLWILFINFLLEQQSTHGGGTVSKVQTFKAALKDASKESCLSEIHYLAWIKLCDNQEALEIAEKGTTEIPSSVELWKAMLQLEIENEDPSRVNQVFKLGIEALKENALELWESIIRYHSSDDPDEVTELIYKDGIKQPKEISSVLKPQYIEWLKLKKGIKVAREVYSKLAVDQPYCKELHEQMSNLESYEMECNYDAWENVHILATQQFGDSDVDVWINCIRFYELLHKKNPQDLEECRQRVYKKAEEMLSEASFIYFKENTCIKK